MEPSELPDKNEAHEQPATDVRNPLDAKVAKVARINRPLLMLAGGLLIAVVTVPLVSGLSPKKKVSAQELAAQQNASGEASGKQHPNLPENVAAGPGKYSDIGKPGVAGRLQFATQNPADDRLAAGSSSPGDPANPGGGQTGLQPGHLTPEEQAALVMRDQRQKDSVSASRASVSFEGRDLKTQDPQPVREISPNLPDANNLNRIVDRLAGTGAAEVDDQNRQGEKRGFTKENRDDFPYLKATLLTPISEYEVKAGSIIPGVLLTGINSDLPGQITAQVRENVYDTVSGRYLLIPQGTRLIGEYDSKISYGQERVLVVWTRIILPNGNSIALEGMPGVDLSGYAGVGGRVNNHYGKLVAGVVLGSVIGAGAQVAAGGLGAPNVPPSFPQLFVSGAAGNINQAGQQITQKNLNLQPTIEIAPGQKINIFLTKDLILRPFTD